MPQPTNAVLQERIENLNKEVSRNANARAENDKTIHEQLEKIYTQTKLTNGRVNRHDKDIEGLICESKEAQYQKGRVSVYCWLIGLLTAGLIGSAIKIFIA